MSRYTTYYTIKRKQYIEFAQRWSSWSKTVDLSEEELLGISKFFSSVGKRFGLITEFRELGVILTTSKSKQIN